MGIVATVAGGIIPAAVEGLAVGIVAAGAEGFACSHFVASHLFLARLAYRFSRALLALVRSQKASH